MKWETRTSVSGKIVIRSLRLLSLLGRALDYHIIVQKDARDCFHSHPARAIRIILKGGYVEELVDGTTRVWKPGMIGVVYPDTVHRIHRLLDGPSHSLWIRGRVRQKTHLYGKGWRYYRD